MDTDACNRETADRCIEAAWIHHTFIGPDAYFDAKGYVLRLPALCEFAPVTDESWDLVSEQQSLLVAAELIRACRRRGWSAHLLDDDAPDQMNRQWVTFRFNGILVEVDYSHYGFFDDDPDEPSHFEVLTWIQLAVSARHCGLYAGYADPPNDGT